MGRGMSVEETRRKFLVGLGRQCIRFDMEGPLVAHKGRLEYLEEGGEFIAPETGLVQSIGPKRPGGNPAGMT